MPMEHQKGERSPERRVTVGWQSWKSVTECNRHMFETKLAAEICFTVGAPDSVTKDILAHKYVLLSRSPVFEAMLDPAWNTKKSNEEIQQIKVPDIQPEVFNEMLRFMYCEDVHLSINMAASLIYVSHKYQLNSLLTICTDYLRDKMSPANVFTILNQSVLCNEDNLTDRCLKMIGENAVQLLQSDTLLELSCDALLCVVQEDKLMVENEKQVYDACMRWAVCQCIHEETLPSDELIRDKLGKVLCNIRFSTFTLHDFMDICHKSNVLLKEEKLEIYESIARNQTPNSSGAFVKRSRTKAWLPDTPLAVMRFQSCQVMKVEPGEQVHGISFRVDTEALLAGVGLFVDKDPMSVSVKVYDDSKVPVADVSQRGLSSNYAFCCNIIRIGSVQMKTIANIFPMHLSKPLPLHPNRIYSVIARIQVLSQRQSIPPVKEPHHEGSENQVKGLCEPSPASDYAPIAHSMATGQQGQTVAKANSNITVTFEDTDVIGREENKSGLAFGQIPMLLFQT